MNGKTHRPARTFANAITVLSSPRNSRNPPCRPCATYCSSADRRRRYSAPDCRLIHATAVQQRHREQRDARQMPNVTAEIGLEQHRYAHVRKYETRAKLIRDGLLDIAPLQYGSKRRRDCEQYE